MYENINSDIYHRLKRKDHYLATNSIWPDILKSDFLIQNIEPDFEICKNRLKRVYRASELSPQVYNKIHKNNFHLFKKLNDIESKYTEQLEALIVKIVKEYFDLDENYVFDVKIEDQEFLDEAIDENEEQFSNYLEITKRNKSIDKDRFSYALAKGASNSLTQIINRYDDELDTIDPVLYKYYNKIISFSQFNPYVINDEDFEKKYQFKKYYSVIKQGGVCYVYVYAPNFISALNQTFLALFSYFLGLKGNLSYISYNNVWNDRLGGMIWKKFISPIKYHGKIKYFLKDISNLQAEDYERFFKECLSSTKLYKKIVDRKFSSYFYR